MAYKELFPVVIGARVWGATWPRQHVLLRSDNEAVVHISKVPALMHLLRDLLMSAACFPVSFSATHVPGAQNQIADAISCFHWQEFWCLAPRTHLHPTLIAQERLCHFGTVLLQPYGPRFSSIYSDIVVFVCPE